MSVVDDPVSNVTSETAGIDRADDDEASNSNFAEKPQPYRWGFSRGSLRAYHLGDESG